MAAHSRAFLALCLGTSLFGSALTTGCNSDDDGGDDKGNGGAGGSGEDATNPAVVVVGQAYTPQEYLTYVRAYPDVPEGEVSFAKFREFGNANVSLNEGKIFVEQDGTVQRFSVNADLELVDGPRFTWADFGIPTANATSTVYVSATRAYTFAPQQGIIVVWDPEAMERTDVIEFEYPERADGMDTWANDGYLVGDKVIWSVFSGNWDTRTPYPGVTLAIVDANESNEPQFVEDSRCLPGGPSFVDDSGDYYVNGGGFFGYFYAYGDFPDGTHTCALRVKAGETEFDPDYELDYEEVTGSYVNTPWIRVTDDHFVTRAWDPAVEFPEDEDVFWAGEALRPLLVDRSEGTSEPYPDLEGVLDVDGVTRIVDGVSYFQVSETGYVESGNTDVVELGIDGTKPKFHLSGGFLLGLERLR